MKNYIKTICQWPVSTLLFVVVLIEQGLTWCLSMLSNPLWPFAGSMLRRTIQRREPKKDVRPEKNTFDVRSNVSVFRDWLKSQDDSHIEAYRLYVENEFGVPADCRLKDPHLYAVRRPKRQENIKRIAYSLSSMNTIKLQHWFSEMRNILQQTT